MQSYFIKAMGAILVGFILLLALVLGMVANDKSWERDCAVMGKHRHNGSVYSCKPDGAAQKGG